MHMCGLGFRVLAFEALSNLADILRLNSKNLDPISCPQGVSAKMPGLNHAHYAPKPYTSSFKYVNP